MEGKSSYPLVLALLAAGLFGAATPASKLLLQDLTPFQLAGLLYLGAALGVLPSACLRGTGLRLPARTDRRNRLRLLGAILCGGVAGPVLLLTGLNLAASASVALWLNLELAATAVLGVCLFRDHLGLLGWLGVVLALAAASLVSLGGGAAGASAGGLILLACICWGLDNHLTALIDGLTPSQSTFWKGLVAGTVNLAVGMLLAPIHASLWVVFVALGVGACCYGASITLYITSAQHLGATRAQVLFSSAPCFGIALSLALLGEPLMAHQVAAALLFVPAIALIIAQNHTHAHHHKALAHDHSHRHADAHHHHSHGDVPPWLRHSHAHHHEALSHSHHHWPDLHHRHQHDRHRA